MIGMKRIKMEDIGKGRKPIELGVNRSVTKIQFLFGVGGGEVVSRGNLIEIKLKPLLILQSIGKVRSRSLLINIEKC